MTKLIYYEFVKLFNKKLLCLLMLALIAANIFCLFENANVLNENGCSIRDISAVYDEIRGKSEGEKEAYIDEKIGQYTESIFSGANYDYRYGTALAAVKENIEKCGKYSDYLTYIDEQSENMEISPFIGKKSFSYRNVILTPIAYRNLKNLNLTAENPEGVLLVTDNTLTDVFFWLCIIMATMQIGLSENEDDLFALIKSKPMGRGYLIFSKITALFILVAMLCLIFFMSNFIFAFYEIGLGDLSRPIQSVGKYYTGSNRLCVGEYLAVNYCVKLLGAFGVSCVFFTLCILSANTVTAVLLFSAFFGFQALIYKLISVNSYLSVFKQINTAAFLNMGELFADYVNINIFGYPFGALTVTLVGLVLFILSASLFSVYFFSRAIRRELKTEKLIKKVINKLSLPAGKNCSIFLHEAYKFFIINKGFAILVLFLCLQFVTYKNITYHIFSEDYYYGYYSQILEGELNAEKRAYLASEEYRFSGASDEMEKLNRQYENSEIDYDFYLFSLNEIDYDPRERTAFKRVVAQCESIDAINQSGIPARFVNQTPYELFFGSASIKANLGDFMKLFFVLALTISSCGSIETQSQVKILIAVSAKGKHSVNLNKMIIIALVGLTAAALAFAPRIVAVYNTYGFPGLNLPIRSLLSLSRVPHSLDISRGLIFIGASVGVIAVASGFIMYYISQRNPNRIIALALSSLIFIAPLAVCCFFTRY